MRQRLERSSRPEIALEFRDVSRHFHLYHEHRNSFQDWFIGLIRPRGRAEEFWALRDVSFTVGWGETLGVLGRNGAGKSTLLKLVTRILEPTSGDILIYGDTHAMLELGAGFHPELSGRDNVYLNGSIYGYDRRQMAERLDSIVAFAELEQFIDTPVKHYSSGMFMRLGFAIAVHMDPEILVIDEVLAVGDANFQAKSHRALRQLKEQGTTILFVSHNSDQIRNFCDRAILLEGGRLLDSGRANDVVDHYQRILQPSTETIELARVRALDSRGATVEVIAPGEDLQVEVLLRVPQSGGIDGVGLSIDLYDADGGHLYGRNAPLPPDTPPRSTNDGNLASVRGVIRNLPLRAGELTVAVALYRTSADGQVLSRRETQVEVRPQRLDTARGMLHLDHEWRWSEDFVLTANGAHDEKDRRK